MKLKCLLPFTHLEIIDEGNLLCCCWGKYKALGSLRNKSISEAWNSKEFQDLRKKIYKGKLAEICDSKTCHILLSGKNWDINDLKKEGFPKKLILDIKNQRTNLSAGPLKITFSDSSRCNLHCKMCFRYFVKDDEKFSVNLIRTKLFQFLNENPKRKLIIKLTGNGDPFFRWETKELLQNFPRKKYPNVSFEILTNGLLLTPEMWKTIKHNKIKEINVSVDGATKKTYENIRLGGKWETLVKNLKFIGRLRQENKINYFYINMVVMRSNFKEMKKFVILGKKLNCDEVNFQRIIGLHNIEENIFDYSDKKAIMEIGRILRDPIFKGSKGFSVNTYQFCIYRNYKPKIIQELRTNIKLSVYKSKKKIKNTIGLL